MLSKDIERHLSGLKPGALRRIRAWNIPGVKSVVTYRFGQWLDRQFFLWKLLLKPVYLIMRSRTMYRYGIDIPKEATIGPGLCVGHYGGIIVSKKSIIGKNLNLSHGVTIGVSGTGENRGVPIIGDNVYIGPGACVFGKIKIGDNVKIGANAVVHKDIPDNAIVVCKPGSEIISLKSNRLEEVENSFED